MIGYLQGEILEHTEGRMLLGIGDKKAAGVVGYSVAVPQSASYGMYASGQKIELFVYTHVREDMLDLYGFSSKLEKTLFLTLLNVNGIGPKSALGILSSADPSQLVAAIMEGDQGFLTRIPGIGKKTAERVVVELRDSMKKKVEMGVFAQNTRSGGESGLSKSGASGESFRSMDTVIFNDAKAALVSLGYKEQEIHPLLNRVLETMDAPPRRAEDLIKTVLRQLA
jgi:Holliday junction DNA helicase RuvA